MANPNAARPVIAIDGPAASGKGTLARQLAAHFDYAHLDTGGLYRAVGLILLRAGEDPSDPVAAETAAKALDPKTLARILEDPVLRDDATAQAASLVAAIPGVRAALLDFQRNFAAHPPGGKQGAVLDGRDVGTVVCPAAPAKIFVEAGVEARAKRRHKELIERGNESIEGAVLQDMQDRDARDRNRAVAPLKPADDAVVLDTTEMDVEAAF